jgi:hypothetical protein
MKESTSRDLAEAVQGLFSTFYLDQLTDDELVSMACLIMKAKVRIEKSPKPAPGQKPKLKAVGTE